MKTKLIARLIACLLIASPAFLSIGVVHAFADVFVDNGDDPGTSSTGTWSVSGGSDPYGADSLWARNGATYTWQFDPQPSGMYEVLMWWSGWPSRATSIPVDINYRDGQETRNINQQQNSGQWNSLGQYYFDSSGSVSITAVYGSSVSTCADAVWFRFISENPTPPTAHIDLITPNPAQPEQAINFEGHGTDTDGSIEAYQWESSIDGLLSDSDSFSTSSLTEGIHTISFKVQDNEGAWSEAATEVLVVGAISTEIIIDNRDAETSQTGTWGVSGGADPYGVDSVWSRDGTTFTWHFTPPQTGDYEVSMWWTYWSSRSESVQVDIEYSGGTATKYINQLQVLGPEQWHSLSEYYFESGSSYNVTITAQPGPSSTCADAVKFNFIQPNVPPVANAGPDQTPFVGATVTLDGSGSSDVDGDELTYLWSFVSRPDGSAAVLSDTAVVDPAFDVDLPGAYVVQLIVNDGTVDSEPDTVTISTENSAPVANAGPDQTPFVGATVTLDGSGSSDVDGDELTYLWSFQSFPEGSTAALSDPTAVNPTFDVDLAGTYVVQLIVNDGLVDSDPVTVTISTEVVAEVVIDNGDPETSYTGTWSISGASGYYGTDSLYARYGPTYTWTFSPTVSGYYEVSMWWTEWSSRSDNVPVDIEYLYGTATKYINQQQNGGQWNSLGEFQFESGVSYNVTITAQPGPSSTCADAVRFIKVPGPGLDVEHIYACWAYAAGTSPLIATLQDIGAYQEGDIWKYTNIVQNKEYIIHIIEDDIAAMKEAFKTENAHIIIVGHANYGLGPIPATPTEKSQEYIDDILYIDDPRILNFSSPFFPVSLWGLIYGQAYPNWQPIFQDGTSGIMPFVFDDPQGPPPYNYYLTYQVPGNPTYYKIETVRSSAIERCPGYDIPAWDSTPDGIPPDPTNPDHRQYFITNYPLCNDIGEWERSQAVSGYYGANYYYNTPPGYGDNEVRWIFRPPVPETYKVFAWWPSSEDNTSDAPYIINHAGGSTTVPKDQTINGGQWNEIDEFYFDADQYSVILTDEVDAGNVVADALRITHPDNPPDIVQANFRAYPRSGTAPLIVGFTNQSTGIITDRLWDFGDESQSTYNSPSHTYTEPGTYTVTLTVSGPSGSDMETVVNYITVDDPAPVIQAEFSNSSPSGQIETIPAEVSFRDRSSGNIVSWSWDFDNDGTIDSNEERPYYTYTTPGLYTVSLTVTDADANSDTKTKQNFVRAVVFDETIDNLDYPTKHYGSRTILFRKELEIPKEEMKYSRLFYASCNTGSYYLPTFNRGIVFYSLWSLAGHGSRAYLRAYIEGEAKTDQELWEIVQDAEPGYDYYDFNKLPSEQQQ